MCIKIHTSPLFAYYVDNQDIVEVNGKTIGECLKNLVAQFPNLKMFDKEGNLYSYIYISVNGEDAYPNELEKPVKDGDELVITPMISGG